MAIREPFLMSYNYIFMICLDWTSYVSEYFSCLFFDHWYSSIPVLFVCHRALFLSHFILLHLKRCTHPPQLNYTVHY